MGELTGWRERGHEIIFEADTPAGKVFDVVLLVAIIISVVAVMFESVSDINAHYGTLLKIVEWTVTILFTIEYGLRILCVEKPRRYIFSFFGVIDLLSVIPTYLSLVFAGTHYFVVIRAVRLLRVFRVLKLARFLGEAEVIVTALKASAAKITVFLGGVFTLVLIIGALFYLIEGEANGFTSIPKSVYWAIVTLTTVGYGDITPQTTLGQFLSSFVMVLGYGIIAVPTGIVSVELSRAAGTPVTTQACQACGRGGHLHDALYCRRCGGKL